MLRKTICKRCGSLSEYDDKSVWEGNREFEEVLCPECGEIIGTVFTDLLPKARLIARGEMGGLCCDQ